MRGVVERPQQPVADAELHDPRDRAVVGVDERERARPRDLAAQLADHAAVQDGRAGAARADRGEHRVEAGGRRAPRATSIDSAPGMTSQRSSISACIAIGSRSCMRRRYSPPSHSPRWTSRRSLDHLRLQAGGGHERLGGLRGPLQRRDEQGAQRLAVQALGDRAAPARGPRAPAAGRRGPRRARRSRPARGRPRRRGGSRSARWRRAGRRTPAGGRSHSRPSTI